MSGKMCASVAWWGRPAKGNDAVWVDFMKLAIGYLDSAWVGGWADIGELVHGGKEVAGGARIEDYGRGGTWHSSCVAAGLIGNGLCTDGAGPPSSLFDGLCFQPRVVALVWAVHGYVGWEHDNLLVCIGPLHPPVAPVLCPVIDRDLSHVIWCWLGAVGASMTSQAMCPAIE